MGGALNFDIFFANDLREPLRVGCAADFKSARLLMEQIASERPGWYFVWNGIRVIARIDTTELVRCGES